MRAHCASRCFLFSRACIIVGGTDLGRRNDISERPGSYFESASLWRKSRCQEQTFCAVLDPLFSKPSDCFCGSILFYIVRERIRGLFYFIKHPLFCRPCARDTTAIGEARD